MADGDGRLHDVTQEDTFEPDAGTVYSETALYLNEATIPRADRLHELAQQDLFEPEGGIFYVNKTALDFIRRKREQNEHVQPSSIKKLVAMDLFEDDDVLVPVDMREMDCDFRGIESMIADTTNTADYFLAARRSFELDSVCGLLDHLPRELTVSDVKRMLTDCVARTFTATASHDASLVQERGAGGSGGGLTRRAMMRYVIRFFYDRAMETGASHGTAKDLIMADINDLFEEFLEDSRARCAQPESPATSAAVASSQP